MSSCPLEWAAQVDAVHNGPFSSNTAPLGIWFKNSQGNICLTLPDNSYYYFNVKRDWYFLQREPNKPDHQCASVYLSPPGDRYYNPSIDTQQAGSFFTGIYWRTAEEKICWKDNDGGLSFTFRKLIDAANLPRRLIAIFTNQEGKQRIVEVDERGVYTGAKRRMQREIDYWLANMRPIGDLNGPVFKNWDRPEAILLTPPPAEERRVARVQAVPVVQEEEEDVARTPLSRGDSDDQNSSRASAPVIKEEAPVFQQEEDLEEYAIRTPSSRGYNDDQNESRASTPVVIKEEIEIEDLEVDDMEEDDMEEEDIEEEEMDENQMEQDEMEEEIADFEGIPPAAAGSAQNCMGKLLAVRGQQGVQGARVSKASSAQQSLRRHVMLLRNGSIALRVSKRSSQRSK